MNKQFGGEWEFEHYCTAFAQEVRIVIEPEGDLNADHPSERQEKAFVWFKENQEELRRMIQASVFDFYQQRRLEVLGSFGAEGAMYCPAIGSSSEVWNLLSKPNVCLLAEYADVYVHFAATWDPEHGITLLFENGSVKKIE